MQWKKVTKQTCTSYWFWSLFNMGLIQINFNEHYKKSHLVVKYSTWSVLCKFAKRDANQDNLKLRRRIEVY